MNTYLIKFAAGGSKEVQAHSISSDEYWLDLLVKQKIVFRVARSQVFSVERTNSDTE